MDAAILWDWAAFALRWLHVITAIAWIGSSFYFIALDLGLDRRPGLPQGVGGEAWQVHGGGFYHIQKYMVAPAHMPERLTWFKWESYATWLSGAALLAVVYWHGAELYLIDPTVADLPVWAAIAISAGSILAGWLIYDRLCRSRWGADVTGLMLILFGVIVAFAFFYAQVFSGRAALLHLGAFTATIMTANVAHVIIPNQRVVVADLKAGRTPAAHLGAQAKQRSLHNNYLTLPVLFLMLSNHYPLAFGTEYAWVIASLTFLMGVSIRHFFNTLHAGGGMPWWTWGATAALFLLIVWLSGFRPDPAEAEAADSAFLTSPHFDGVYDVVLTRCSMCHAAQPAWDGLAAAPGGVVLETEAQIATNARAIWLQAAASHAMPPGNLTWMEPEERALLATWYEESR